MSYPMDYQRIINRNDLGGDYSTSNTSSAGIKPLIAGDLRRLETDQRDERHLRAYAKVTDLSVEDVRSVLNLFFLGDVLSAAHNA